MPTFGQDGRQKQCLFRATSATISEAARYPDDEVGKRNQHLLALGYEQENLYPSLRGPTGALRFFGDRKIKWWRSTRSGDEKGIDGPTRNLASSQIACVNFLLPLTDIPGALAACLRTLDSDVEAVVPIEQDGLNSLVEFEWLGVGCTLEKSAYTRGANATSADAFLVAQCKGGHRRAYLIEWKYVEAYETGQSKGEGRSGQTRRSRYEHLYLSDDSSFTGAVPLEELLYEPIYQIMRLRLLADRMIKKHELNVTQAKVVVVCPEQNREYRDQITSPKLADRIPNHTTLESAVKFLLKDPDGFTMTSPEKFGAGINKTITCPAITDWFYYHIERYGWQGSSDKHIV